MLHLVTSRNKLEKPGQAKSQLTKVLPYQFGSGSKGYQGKTDKNVGINKTSHPKSIDWHNDPQDYH